MAAIGLPLEWEAWFRLAGETPELPREGFAWPLDGQAVARIFAHDVADLPGAPGVGSPDLLVAEVDSEKELLRVADAAARTGFGAILFVEPGMREQAISEAQAMAPELSLVTRLPPGETRVESAGRRLEELVRRRVYKVLLAHWRTALATYEERLAHIIEGTDLPHWGEPARPSMAPLSTIEQAHVAGVLGLWWPGSMKASKQLGITQPTVRRMRSRLPAALESALADPLPSSRNSLKMLVVEDDPLLAEATRRLLVTIAERRLGRGLEVVIEPSAAAGRRHMLESGFPDLLWVDVQLEAPRSGISLVSWLRAQHGGSVVLGKTARAPHEDLRELTRLGALSIWTSAQPRELHAMLGDAMRASDEGHEIARLEGTTAKLEQKLDSMIDRGLIVARAARRVTEVRSIISGLEVDLGGPQPVGIGDPNLSLNDVRGEAARIAVNAADGNVSRAARELGIGYKRILKLLHRRRASGRQDDPDDF